MSRLAAESYAALVRQGEGEGKRALVTGLRGFTGHYMARELADGGYRVFGTVLPGEQTSPNVFEVDLCNRAAVARMVEQVRPDVVVHLAGIAFVAHAHAELMCRVSVVGTHHLLEALAAARHRLSAVLLASSANIDGNAGMARIDESVAPAPANDYAVSKLAMEYMARLWMDRMPIIIARPFNYGGRGQAENFLDAITLEIGERVAITSAIKYERPGQMLDVNPAFVRANDVLRLEGCNDKLASVIGAIEPTPLAETLRWMYQE